MSSFRSTPLFGGALIVDLPSTFADVRYIYPLKPHNSSSPRSSRSLPGQRWLHQHHLRHHRARGRAGSGPAVDGAALTTHLEDIVDSDVDTVKVWNTSNTQFSKLPEGIPAYTLIATQTPPPAPDSKSPDFTAIVLTLIRLERESTDILITINVPHIKGEYTEEEVDMQMGKQGKLIESSVEIAAKIWETF
ncbi:hypothetical protein LSUB1_G004017 [Lachnellula subtilissima]|uniref:Ran guanine nucleotide release factor n=1 Tax=Lachnellula subtilissima TaxID=602034 RepID=A0A8H8RMC0_9HELO|nr:hypothetical protein LSUB1_G004017 [Lachnellula subtilissima]